MVTLLLALALVAPAAQATVPAQGVLVPGQSLAGVRLGDTPARVRTRLGSGYDRCTACTRPTWYFRRAGRSLVLAVTFRRGQVTSISTLGSPLGWRTSEGLVVGQGVDRVQALYGTLKWHICIGYGALSMPATQDAVTTIYTSGDVVYGFALARRTEPLCR